MTVFLNEIFLKIKAQIIESRFKNEEQEINFFKNIKLQILGKFIC